MKDLTQFELININGGQDCHPYVSSDASVQEGYGYGWHIGHALGNTIQMFGNVVDSVFGIFD